MDRDGKWAETLWDIANVVMDVESARDNFSNGEIVSGLVDVGATVLDCIAAIAPGIPGGVGSVVKAARSTDKVTDALNGVKTVDNVSDAAKTTEKSIDGNNYLEKRHRQMEGMLSLMVEICIMIRLMKQLIVFPKVPKILEKIRFKPTLKDIE